MFSGRIDAVGDNGGVCDGIRVGWRVGVGDSSGIRDGVIVGWRVEAGDGMLLAVGREVPTGISVRDWATRVIGWLVGATKGVQATARINSVKKATEMTNPRFDFITFDTYVV